MSTGRTERTFVYAPSSWAIRGKVVEQERARDLPRAGVDPQEIATRAQRLALVGVGLGARCRLRAEVPPATLVPHVRTRCTWPSCAEIDEHERRGAPSASASCPRTRSSPPARPSTPARVRRAAVKSTLRTRIRSWSGSTAPGSAASSTSTNRGSVSASTFTSAWMSKPFTASGRRPPRFRWRSSERRTARRPTRRFARPRHESRVCVRPLLLLEDPSADHGSAACTAILGRYSGVAQLAERVDC